VSGIAPNFQPQSTVRRGIEELYDAYKKGRVKMITVRSRPWVHIGLPVYNGEQYLTEALNSLLAQTYAEFELIICDNASTDRTEEICRAYAAMDTRIRYIRNETNIGAARNYMHAFECSSAKYFKWATCDDLSGPEFLTRCVEILDREPTVVLAYPKTKLMNENGEIPSEYEDGLHLQSSRASERFVRLLQNLRLCNAIYGLMRTEVVKRITPLGSYIMSDICFLGELSLHGKFWEVPEFLFYRRIHHNAYSSQEDISKLLEFYNPWNRHQPILIKCRYYKEHFASVVRSPLGMLEKMWLNCYLLRMIINDRDELKNELYIAMRQVFYRMRRSTF
jgi:glycosyltransferase involved in cell wall biosynthesis